MNSGNAKRSAHEIIKVGNTYEIDIHSLDEDGVGSASLYGVRLYISGGVPGDRCIIRISHRGKNSATGELIKIITPSPVRLPVRPCSHTKCDGCTLLQMSYEAERTWKQDKVRKAFADNGIDSASFLEEIESPGEQFAYRNSAKLVIGGTMDKPVIGIYKRHTHDITPLTECRLHHPLINRIIRTLLEGIKKLKIPIYHSQSGSGFLRYLGIRIAEDIHEAMVVLVTARRSYNELHHLSKFLQQQVPEITVIAQNVNTTSGNTIFGQQDFFHTKKKFLTTSLGHLRLQLSPRSFFQVNTVGAKRLYDLAYNWLSLTGSERVLDIYCGVGGIGLYSAAHAGSVTGLEFNLSAVADAEINARLNRLKYCRFLAGDAKDLIPELLDDGENFSRIILNPPRTGCSPAVLNGVALMKPDKIAYISCNPLTLARDLVLLSDKGFKISHIYPVDMFPQTPHIECVACIEPANR